MRRRGGGAGGLKNRGSFGAHAGIIDATCSFCRFFVLKKSQPVEKYEERRGERGGGGGEEEETDDPSSFRDGERVLLKIGS